MKTITFTSFGIGTAGDGHGIGVADHGHGFVVRFLVAVGATQALAVSGQRGTKLWRCATQRFTAPEGFRVGVGHRSVQGGPERGLIATGSFVAPSAEEVQFLPGQKTGITPSGIHAPVPGESRQRPERQQGGELELAALAARGKRPDFAR